MIRPLAFLVQRIREAFLKGAFAEVPDPRHRRYMRALASLPDAEHAAFRLARVEGLNVPRIAAELGIPNAQAETHLAHAIEMIASSLRRQERKGW
ncbi:RNA polymerase sigma factor [Novosphingobium sp. MBES04]|uniref:RNA polymerase sigma factor n=1 Tax=Novosphingobium sp. MBES04 TaxID=1206458 RepID=UPI00057C660B|nr:sigma-70 region 4 domain-containing protein [Novosphingobium sp. MBES04]GAM04029.1 RNA polymerase sigma factor [Novosphingobium sp. MBES04]